ncbi:MAG: DASH family cryptochrome, partial [Christiangramia sp.]
MSTGLVWFRNDLRIEDNLTLSNACKSHENVIGIYFFDPRHYEETKYGFPKTGKFRANFLIETIENLRKNLSNLNITLLVFHARPEDKIPEISQEFSISGLYFQKEWTAEEKKVENSIRNILPEVKFHCFYQQFLYHPEDIPYSDFSEIPKVFTEFRKKCEKNSEIRSLTPPPSKRPKNNLIQKQTLIPTLNDLGLDNLVPDTRSAFPFKGGEDEAKNRIQEYFWNNRDLEKYKETRNGLIGKDYSSKLSAWLANGSISPRQIYYQVKKYEKEIKSNQSTYWLIFELIWRDFFKYISLKHGNKIFQLKGILENDLELNRNQEKFEEWIQGKTKEDFVNANMKEIAATGFMSNRGRQNVNSFWAKELKQDWRMGARYFESLLIDYDVHSNWGNWMYNSGVGNDPRDRKFNIKSQADRY